MRHLCLPAALGIVLCACDQQTPRAAPPQENDSATGSWPATRSTEGGSYEVTLMPSGDGIKLNEHFSLQLTIVPKQADPSPLAVVVDADMPAHGHGMNTKPELHPQGALKYQVDGMLFHMAGNWVVQVDVTAGGKTERATFPVKVE